MDKITKTQKNKPITGESEDIRATAFREATSNSPENDPVNSPGHYNIQGIEVIDAIDAYIPHPLSFCLGNCIKYLLRSHHKGKPLEDLKKCRWYLDRAIRNLEDE